MNMSPMVAWQREKRITAQAFQESCRQVNDQLRQLEEAQMEATEVMMMSGMFQFDEENGANRVMVLEQV